MVGVNLDGDEWPWVMVAGAEDSRGSDDVPAHERTGRLPADCPPSSGDGSGLSARRSPMRARRARGPWTVPASSAPSTPLRVTRHVTVTRESHVTEPP
jgi:hypothetical protein